jgi:hypothetical protein
MPVRQRVSLHFPPGGGSRNSKPLVWHRRSNERVRALNLRTVVPILIAMLALSLAGCNRRSAHEQVMDDISMQIDRMKVVLSSVNDKPSAERAVSNMKTIVSDLKKAEARAKALGQPDAALKPKLAERMKRKMTELEKAFEDSQTVLARAGPEATAIVMKGMKDLGPDMDRVTGIYADPKPTPQ